MLLAGRTGIPVEKREREKGKWRGLHIRHRLNACALVTGGCGEGKEEGRESRAGEGRAAERGRGRRTLTPRHLR